MWVFQKIDGSLEQYGIDLSRKLEEGILAQEDRVQIDDERYVDLAKRVECTTNEAEQPPLTVKRLTGFTSLFDFNDLETASPEPCVEWRKLSESATWEGIVSGLAPGSKYSLRIRPVAPANSPWEDQKGWCDKLDVTTTKPAEPDQIVLADEEKSTTELSGSAAEKPKRWFRVRPAFEGDTQAVDVVWRVGKTLPVIERRWNVTVFIENVKTGKRRKDGDRLAGQGLPCGIVRVNHGEVACIELAGNDCEATDYATECHPCMDQVQSVPALRGRYIWIRKEGSLRLAEVRVKDLAGMTITSLDESPISAAMSSSYSQDIVTNRRNFPAHHILDGRLDTFCWTNGQSTPTCSGGASPTAGRVSPSLSTEPEWVRVDLGRVTSIGLVEIVSRIDKEPDTSLRGATVSITNGRNDAAAPVWQATMDEDRCIYRFVFTDPARVGLGPPEVRAEPELEQVTPESLEETTFFTSPEQVTPESLEETFFTYPENDFEKLRKLVVLLTGNTYGQKAKWEGQPGIVLAEQGLSIQLPFEKEGQLATEFRVLKQFKSKAMPYLVEMKAADGKSVQVIMKDGDDMRQDQLVLATLRYFNHIWQREGVNHYTQNGSQHPVHAPAYRVATASLKAGFVDLLPAAVPIEEIGGKDSMEGNEWRPTPELLASTVAAFVSGYVLRMRDRHTGNMLLSKGKYFANIDFGWLEEQPGIDTGKFPIPKLLAKMFRKSQEWGEFCDLCWDALQVLRKCQEEVIKCWRHLLKNVGFDTHMFNVTMPGKWCERMEMDRCTLDLELTGTWFDNLATWKKDTAHEVLGPAFAATTSGVTTVVEGMGEVLGALGGVVGLVSGVAAATPPPSPRMTSSSATDDGFTQRNSGQYGLMSPMGSSGGQLVDEALIAQVKALVALLEDEGEIYGWSVERMSGWLKSNAGGQTIVRQAAEELVDGAVAAEMSAQGWVELGASHVEGARIVSKIRLLKRPPKRQERLAEKLAGPEPEPESESEPEPEPQPVATKPAGRGLKGGRGASRGRGRAGGKQQASAEVAR